VKLEYAIAQKIGSENSAGTDHVSILRGGDIFEVGYDLRKESLISNKSGMLFLLCDGGSSNLKALECSESCNSEITALMSDIPDVGSYDEIDGKRKLGEGFRRANELLLQLSAVEEKNEMICSIGGLWFCKEWAVFSHVGNVRIYRYSDSVLELLTDDHTEAWELVKQGKLTPEKIMTYPGNRSLTQVLGGKGKLHPEFKISTLKIEPGDSYMICSDGISRFLNDRVLEGMFSQNTDGEGRISPQLGGKIVEAAFEKSEGKEHASVILIQAFPSVSRWADMIQSLG